MILILFGITFQLFKLLCLAQDHWRGFRAWNAHMVHIVISELKWRMHLSSLFFGIFILYTVHIWGKMKLFLHAQSTITFNENGVIDRQISIFILITAVSPHLLCNREFLWRICISPIFTGVSTRFAQNDQPVTHRGRMISCTTCFACKVIMKSHSNTPKRRRRTARFF